MNRFLKYAFLLSILVAFSVSCHGPKFEEGSAAYSVYIYPNNISKLKHNNYYTFYAILTPKSECTELGQYHWYTPQTGQLVYQESGEISVEKAREALGSSYNIPDDSYCSYYKLKAQTYSIGTLAVQLSFQANSTLLPSYTLYTSVGY